MRTSTYTCTYIFFKLILNIFYFKYEEFACIYVGTLHAHLEPEDVRRSQQISPSTGGKDGYKPILVGIYSAGPKYHV